MTKFNGDHLMANKHGYKMNYKVDRIKNQNAYSKFFQTISQYTDIAKVK